MDKTADPELEVLVAGWQRHRRWVLSLLISCLIAVVGWRYWQYHTQVAAEQASEQYQALLGAVAKSDYTTLRNLGDELVQQSGASPYAKLAALLLAKVAVADNDLETASAQLAWVHDNTPQQDGVWPIATARLARIKLQQGASAEALALLESPPEGYVALFAEIRGDILQAQNKPDQARVAYQLALAHLPEGVVEPGLNFKLMDLGVLPPEKHALRFERGGHAL